MLRTTKLRTTGGADVIKLLYACRAKFSREVQVLIRKLRDFEGQIEELSQTCTSRHARVPAVYKLRAPLEARFIAQQSGSAIPSFWQTYFKQWLHFTRARWRPDGFFRQRFNDTGEIPVFISRSPAGWRISRHAKGGRERKRQINSITSYIHKTTMI